MKVMDVLEGLNYSVLHGSNQIHIDQIAYDSRKVEKNTLFICIEGFKVDGHKFALQAIQNGAVAIVVEKPVEGIPKEVPIIQVQSTRKAMARISANFYGMPAKKLNVVGVTGTNGKTTTTFLISSILQTLEHKVGVIGTIENRIGNRILKTDRTTPEALELQRLFYEMAAENVEDVVMEVSSHSLDLHRVDCLDFEVGVFTNLTQDHLDFHKTMENYREAKSKLFQKCRFAVINHDDPAGSYMAQKASGKVVTFGIDTSCDLQAKNVRITGENVRFTLEIHEKQEEFELGIPGKFSVYNALGAIGAALSLGISVDHIQRGLKNVKGVAGRFQSIKSAKGFHVIVDYAHTPDGLQNILEAARGFAKGRIITIFGCGGDRDRLKRPIMGEIAGKMSDYSIITSDNPRSEEPDQILADIESGIQKTHCPYIKLMDRRAAIEKGIEMAKADDIVIIAGKGHENYQELKHTTIHFDDIEVVKEILQEE